VSELTVEKFFKSAGGQLGLRLVAGRLGLSRPIPSALIQKPGLALTGLTPLDHHRVQVLGEKELLYLRSLSREALEAAAHRLFDETVPCVIVSRNLEIDPVLLEVADAQRVPLFRTHFETGAFIQQLSKYFLQAFQRVGTVHGVLVEVFGLGVLIIGASGMGKSEAALDLITRGHRLVADDVVDVTQSAGQVLTGTAASLIRHHMEIRGLGILNVRDLFGISAVRERHTIDLVVELVDWDQRRDYDRLGLEGRFHSILDTPVPMLQIPVSPGRSLTTIIEVAARNQLLKKQGLNAAEALQRKLAQAMKVEPPQPQSCLGDENDG
jgi:HPr kinase/phosphorylase